MDIKSNYIPTPTQRKAHEAPHRYKLFGGAMGGGKSKWLCEEGKELSMMYPGNRGVICRYHLSDFKNSTLKTLLECLPEELISNHNRSEHTITLVNGAEIIYMGLSEEESISKLKSMEIGWFAIDEASEVPKSQFLLFQSRLRRILPNGKAPKFFGLLASNPDDCWLKDYFVLGGGGEDAIFIPSLPRDNPYLPSDYEQQLRKTYPEDWVRRFLEGSWDDLTAGDKVIKSDWVRAAINREILIEDKPVVSCDVARFGDDEIVIQFGRGNALINQQISYQQSLMETVGRIINFRKKFNAKIIVIDDVGVGGGVTDRLREMKEHVMPINAGSSPVHPDKYHNLKSEMWFYAAELFQAGAVSIINDPILIRQLGSVRYKVRSNSKLEIESKSETKKRLGSSPDRADAFIMLLWASSKIRDKARDFSRKLREDNPVDGLNPYGWNYHYGSPQEVITYGR
jgi:phage terminase large subunit